jgi:hypothetical protein
VNTENRQAALDRLSGRAPVPVPAVLREPPPRLQHYPAGTTRPVTAPLPAEPLRVTRSEIEAALVGSFTYNPHREEIVDRIIFSWLRVSAFP